VLARYNKFWVALSGFLLSAISAGLIDETWGQWTALAIGAITTAGVFAIGNDVALPDDTGRSIGDTDPPYVTDRGQVNGGVIWTIVGVLLIIALVIYLLGQF